MKKFLSFFVLLSFCMTINQTLCLAAQNDDNISVFRRKIKAASEKEQQVKNTEKLEKMKASGIMPYFIKAQELADKKDFSGAAKTLDDASKIFPNDFDALTRWRGIYHHKAGNYEAVIFLFKDMPIKSNIYSYLLADSYRQLGAYDKAKTELTIAESNLPPEIKVPKIPTGISSLASIDNEYTWIGAALIYAEKALLGYTQLENTKDVGTIIQDIDSYWQCVPIKATEEVLPITDFYGFNLIDVSLVTGFVLMADGELNDAEQSLKFYISNKKIISEIDQRLVDEAIALYEGITDEPLPDRSHLEQDQYEIASKNSDVIIKTINNVNEGE